MESKSIYLRHIFGSRVGSNMPILLQCIGIALDMFVQRNAPVRLQHSETYYERSNGKCVNDETDSLFESPRMSSEPRKRIALRMASLTCYDQTDADYSAVWHACHSTQCDCYNRRWRFNEVIFTICYVNDEIASLFESPRLSSEPRKQKALRMSALIYYDQIDADHFAVWHML